MTLKEIWSRDTERGLFFIFWGLHADWLQNIGWQEALKTKKITPPTGDPNHRTVGWLREFIAHTGLVNAHFGLTSSDVEDNVRIMLLDRACRLIANMKNEALPYMGFSDRDPQQIPAFSHWQAAGRVSISEKYRSMFSPLVYLLSNKPVARAKQLGGPLGNNDDFWTLLRNKGLKPLPFPWSKLNLRAPHHYDPIQSSSYITETELMNWLCAVAANVHKIAADLRFYASQNLLLQNKPTGYRGSSSIPRKNNPIKYEKVCSMMASVATAQSEMWYVTANNGCERTLNTSWNIRRLMERVTTTVHDGLKLLLSDPILFNFQSCDQHKESIRANHRRRRLTLDILSGKTRFEAYEEQHTDTPT